MGALPVATLLAAPPPRPLELVATHRSGRRGRRERGYWAIVHGPHHFRFTVR